MAVSTFGTLPIKLQEAGSLNETLPPTFKDV